MMNREEGEAKRAFWMEHLRECSSAGEQLSSYALRHGLNIGERYHWTRVLRREGLWPLQPKSKTAAPSAVVASKSLRLQLSLSCRFCALQACRHLSCRESARQHETRAGARLASPERSGLTAIKFWSREKSKGTNALKKRINPTRVPIEEAD